jgi:hypothetical protein
MVALALNAVSLRGRRVVLLEAFWAKGPWSRGWKRRLYPVYLRVIGLLLRRSILVAHVLSAWERDHYSAILGLRRDRVCFVPFPLGLDHQESLGNEPTGTLVMASGRAACDWATLFDAARAASWPVTVVCGAHDWADVKRLNSDGRARVLTEITPEKHDELLCRARVYVLSLAEQNVSSGHVRLGAAIRAGVPVVATAVKGLEGYAVDRVTAKVVPVGDPMAMREAVDELLADSEAWRALRRSAFAYARDHQMSTYLEEIRRMVDAACDRLTRGCRVEQDT